MIKGNETCGSRNELGEKFVDLGAHLEKGLDTPIYRYVSADRYFDLIEKRVNALSHITMWEDPYEGFIFRAAADADPEQAMEIYGRFKYYYGQCWTLCGVESDLRWRASGARGTVVRIRSTVRKLCESLMEVVERCARGEVRVKFGKVEYEKNFDDRLGEENLWRVLNGDEHERLELFFHKRLEFQSEDEFRVIVQTSENVLDRDRDTDGRFLKYDIDPTQLIDEVLVDPCMSRDKWEQLVCRSLHRLGRDKLRQSALFDWPKILGDVSDMNYGITLDISEIPSGQVFHDYLVNRFHAVTPHVRSIWSRVKRVLSAAIAVNYAVSQPPTEAELSLLIQNMGDLVSNGDSAANCRSAVRHYARALQGTWN